jgi:uncharacterized protein (DUF983 family)
MRGRCPACGQGRLLHSYLKVAVSCSHCGEELHHHQADDFPAYLTIFVVGHVLVAALLVVDDVWPDLPLTLHFILWPVLVVLLSLWLLPILKGSLVGYQWALRMHGFETAHRSGVGLEAAHPPANGADNRSAA